MAQTPTTQRDFMRQLVELYGRIEDVVCKQYALAEMGGDVKRDSDKGATTPEAYARALWRDGVRRGWL